jgi:Ca-activated chloride channel homolog
MRLLTIVFLFFFLTASSLNDARKANEAFERGDYVQAVEYYQRAIEQDPDNARLHFNMGNALYELGRTDEAKESYDRFRNLTDNAVEQSFADYNTGRMLADQEQYDEALNFFREALKKNPDDDDARHNYELALRQQQQQEQQQDEDPESNGDDEEEQDQEQQQNGDQDQEQDQPPDMGEQPDSPEGQDGEQEQQPDPLDMSPEEAENILDALRQLERELLENRKKESSDPQTRNEQDW